jgi:hypothetical protein
MKSIFKFISQHWTLATAIPTTSGRSLFAHLMWLLITPTQDLPAFGTAQT